MRLRCYVVLARGGISLSALMGGIDIDDFVRDVKGVNISGDMVFGRISS
jgi:hypothetical protein